MTKHNREGCVQAGYCILGCSYDAKQSMLVTYVPRGASAGARHLRQRARGADRGRRAGTAARAARRSGHVVDHDGRAGRAVPTCDAQAVVLAAGAVASPDLLLRSGLANGTGQVGRNLHLHPSVMVAGFFDEPIHAYRGIPQSYYVDEFIDLDARSARAATC